MALKNLPQRIKELAMSQEARIEEAYRKAVPAELANLVLAGGGGEAGLLAESLAKLTGQAWGKSSVEEISNFLRIYTAVVKGYLIDGARLHDIRAELLRKHETLLRAENIGRVTAFCILHAGDSTFFMTNEDAEEQLAAMEESLAEP